MTPCYPATTSGWLAGTAASTSLTRVQAWSPVLHDLVETPSGLVRRRNPVAETFQRHAVEARQAAVAVAARAADVA